MTLPEARSENPGAPPNRGGPKTEEGKDVTRWNATRHGIRSPAPVVPGIERAEDWEHHRDLTLKSLAPEGHLETNLAERVALLSWRLHRVTRYETETIALSQERIEDDLADRRRFSRVSILESIHPEDGRARAKYATRRRRLLQRLPKLEDERVLPAEDAEAILWAALSRTDVVDRGEETEEESLSRLSIPGVPESVDWEEFEGWTAGMVRAGLEAIARATDEDPEALLEALTEAAKIEERGAKFEVKEMERELSMMRRERILPDEKTLEKITRYEAHLSRLLYKTLHELEALQARRSGSAAPLARIDVDAAVLSGE
jgi:hypothetical protein